MLLHRNLFNFSIRFSLMAFFTFFLWFQTKSNWRNLSFLTPASKLRNNLTVFTRWECVNLMSTSQMTFYISFSIRFLFGCLIQSCKIEGFQFLDNYQEYLRMFLPNYVDFHIICQFLLFFCTPFYIIFVIFSYWSCKWLFNLLLF